MKNLIKKLGIGIALAGISISVLGCGNTYLFSKSEFDYSEKNGLCRKESEAIKGIIDYEMRIQRIIVPHNESLPFYYRD